MEVAPRSFLRRWWFLLLAALVFLLVWGWLTVNKMNYPLDLESCVAETGAPYRVAHGVIEVSLLYEMKVTSWCA